MKYGIVISAEETKFGDIILKGNLDENIRKAAELGYDGVELAVKNPAKIDKITLHRNLAEGGLELPVIGTGQIFVDHGLSFADSDPGKRRAAAEKVCEISELAEEFNSAVIIGLVRGVLPPDSDMKAKETALERIRESMQICLSYAEEWKGKFLLEPMHRYHTALINTLDDAAEFIEGDSVLSNSERVTILADTWHMNIEEMDIISPLIKNRKLVTHIHLADSNRRAPGYGHIDFKQLSSCLSEMEYGGYGSFEVQPWPTAEICAADALHFMRMIDRQMEHQRSYIKVGKANG